MRSGASLYTLYLGTLYPLSFYSRSDALAVGRKVILAAVWVLVMDAPGYYVEISFTYEKRR